jgi:uncharacterized protein YacL (UPF0231 family)
LRSSMSHSLITDWLQADTSSSLVKARQVTRPVCVRMMRLCQQEACVGCKL